jgi:hypothetical protein
MPPGQNGPASRSGERASVVSVSGSSRSTQAMHGSPGRVGIVWRSANSSPGSRSTSIVAPNASRCVTIGARSGAARAIPARPTGAWERRGPPSSAGQGLFQ